MLEDDDDNEDGVNLSQTPQGDNKKEIKVEDKSKETKVETKAEFKLPMEEASDDWMLDDDVGVMLEDEDDKEEDVNISQTPLDKSKEMKDEDKSKVMKVENKSTEAKFETKAAFNLPMEEASEDWMLDDDVGVMLEDED